MFRSSMLTCHVVEYCNQGHSLENLVNWEGQVLTKGSATGADKQSPGWVSWKHGEKMIWGGLKTAIRVTSHHTWHLTLAASWLSASTLALCFFSSAAEQELSGLSGFAEDSEEPSEAVDTSPSFASRRALKCKNETIFAKSYYLRIVCPTTSPLSLI